MDIFHAQVNKRQKPFANIFEKTAIEVGSSRLYASFDTFCVQIDQLFEAQ